MDDILIEALDTDADSLMITAEEIGFPKKIITMLLIFYQNHIEKNKAMNDKREDEEEEGQEEKDDEANQQRLNNDILD